MIRYCLVCDTGHRFDAWFGDSGAFDGLADQGLVTCPDCGSPRVSKTIMAPAVVGHAPPVAESPTSATPKAGAAEPDGPRGVARDQRDHVRTLRARVLAKTQDVGGRFPAEARRMHDGVIPQRDIRGEATLAEARALLDDGILILPLPGTPDDLN